MENQTAQTIIEIIDVVGPELYFLLFKGIVGLIILNLITNLTKNVAIYVRLRFSDLFSKRTVIIYNGFEGVIEEISLYGIFIKDINGVTKFVPLNRWYMGDIRYPNTLIQHEDDNET